jgi:hypothetical protein
VTLDGDGDAAKGARQSACDHDVRAQHLAVFNLAGGLGALLEALPLGLQEHLHILPGHDVVFVPDFVDGDLAYEVRQEIDLVALHLHALGHQIQDGQRAARGSARRLGTEKRQTEQANQREADGERHGVTVRRAAGIHNRPPDRRDAVGSWTNRLLLDKMRPLLEP